MIKDNNRIYSINFDNKKGIPIIHSQCDYGWNNLQGYIDKNENLYVIDISFKFEEGAKINKWKLNNEF